MHFSQIYLIKFSKCFRQVHCPSSGLSQHCIHVRGICHASWLLIFFRICKKQRSFGNRVTIKTFWRCTCCIPVITFALEFKVLKTNQSVTTTPHFKAVHASHYFQHIRCWEERCPSMGILLILPTTPTTPTPPHTHNFIDYEHLNRETLISIPLF